MNITPLEYKDSQLVCYLSNKDIPFLISKVKNNAKYDIKRQEVWDARMKDAGCDIYFYGSQFQFYYENELTNAEEFGNILYGALGNAGGYELLELKNGGSLYSLMTEHHLDDENDKRNIETGYNLYEAYKHQHSYLHKE